MEKSLAQIIIDTENTTDKNTVHTFVDWFYDIEFAKFRNKPITLIEVGVWEGASIRLWYDYFSQAEIYGIDIQVYNQEFVDFCKTKSNIHYIIRDAYEKSTVEDLPDYDICIDDASHHLEAQLLYLKLYLPKMKADGICIIEDIRNDDYCQKLERYIVDNYPNFIHGKLDLRPIKGQYNDIMIVVRHK